MVNKMVHAWNLFKNFASLKVENKENSIDDENVNNEWWKWMIFEHHVCTNQLKCETKNVGLKGMKGHKWCKSFFIVDAFHWTNDFPKLCTQDDQAMYTIHSLMDEYAPKLNSYLLP